MAQPSLWASTWLEMRRGWLAYVIIGSLLLGVIAVFVLQDSFRNADGVRTFAIITSLGSAAFDEKYRPETVHVIAKNGNGRIGTLRVPYDRIAGCRVGDTIPASEVGSSLRLEPEPC